MSCCCTQERFKCYSVCFRCKCCGKKTDKKVKIPCTSVAVEAFLAQNQAYGTTPSNVLFNSVTLNETCYRPCKDRCDKERSCGCSCNQSGCGQNFSQFYNSTTGIATVPPCGEGKYVIATTLVTNSENTSTASILINGVPVASKDFGGATGNNSVDLVVFKDLCPCQTISISVRDNTGSASLTPSVDNTSLRIARIQEPCCC